MTAVYDDALAPVGVNLAQFSLLRNIDRANAISLTELGHRVDLDRSTVGRNVKVLERMGLVQFGASEDGREALVRLSAEGRRTLLRGEPLWAEAQSVIERKIGRNGITQLHALLSAI